MPLLTRLVFVLVVAMVVGLASTSAEAARLAIRSTASGGGTLVNDGTGDVGTTDGSATGFTTAWSEMGLLSADDLLVFGSYAGGPDIDDTGQLTFLRVLATVPEPCPTCDLIGDVTAGDLPPDSENVQNVAWFADMFLLAGSIPLPITMNEGQLYTFGISALDAAALDALILQYGAANVRIGLTAAVFFPVGNDLDQGAPVFETVNGTVPEPGSLLLLGTGLLAAARSRRSRRRSP